MARGGSILRHRLPLCTGMGGKWTGCWVLGHWAGALGTPSQEGAIYQLHQVAEAGPDSWKRVTVLQTICHHIYIAASLAASNGQGTRLLSAGKALRPV